MSKNIATKVNFDEENPFIEDPAQKSTRVGYVYKLWQIENANNDGGRDLKICIRCKVHTHTGTIKADGERQYMNVYAFNEHTNERSDWRSQIDNSLITCLNKEMSDNSFKSFRWLLESLLSDADLVKFAFVSRKHMNENKKHVLLGTHTVQTKAWAKQMNVSLDRMWCIIKFIANEILDATQEAQAKRE